MMAKYNLKAETGKFESKLQQPGQQVNRIAAGDVVVGVVQMHEAIIHMIKALQGSQELLIQLRAAIEIDDLDKTALVLMAPHLERLIKANDEALGQIELD